MGVTEKGKDHHFGMYGKYSLKEQVNKSNLTNC